MSEPRRVYLHVGLQKTGTTYLQKIFDQSRAELAAQGLDLVPPHHRGTFELMLDVRRRVDPEHDRPGAATALARLPGQLAKAPGDRALISEESLAEAWDKRIDALLEACAEREAHVVLTVRDLGRQVPSAWQQMVQSGHSLTFEELLVLLHDRDNPQGSWANKDLPRVLTRWARHVPPERIHVVTVPPAGSHPTLLLERYCTVLGVDPTRLDTRLDRHNQSVGRVEAEVLRRVNAHLDESHRYRDVYGDVGKRFFAVRVLGATPGRKILVPYAEEAWLREISQEFADHLREGGYDVVGNPDDLLPAASAFGDPDDGRPTEQEVADRAAEALAVVLTDRMDTLRARRRTARAEREQRAAAKAAARAASAPPPPPAPVLRRALRRTTKVADRLRRRLDRHRPRR